VLPIVFGIARSGDTTTQADDGDTLVREVCAEWSDGRFRRRRNISFFLFSGQLFRDEFGQPFNGRILEEINQLDPTWEHSSELMDQSREQQRVSADIEEV